MFDLERAGLGFAMPIAWPRLAAAPRIERAGGSKLDPPARHGNTSDRGEVLVFRCEPSNAEDPRRDYLDKWRLCL
jgi:hypothetical protein